MTGYGAGRCGYMTNFIYVLNMRLAHLNYFLAHLNYFFVHSNYFFPHLN